MIQPQISVTPERPNAHKNERPLVSVIMPVYNQAEFVLQAINSILNQTFSNFEFIAIDDGSTDGTPDRLATINDSRFRYVLAPHCGFIRALARGYLEAQGDWIARMDSDDISHPDRLRIQLEFLADHPECHFVGSAYGFMSPSGQLAAPRKKFEWRYVKPSQITLGGRVFGDATTVFRRSIAAEVGFFDPDFENENPLWYRLLAKGKGAVIGEALYFSRWRMGTLSTANFENLRRAHIAIRKRYDAENASELNRESHATEKATLLSKGKQGVFLYLAAGDRAAARELALCMLRRWPIDLRALRLLAHALIGTDRFRFWRRRDTRWYVRVNSSKIVADLKRQNDLVNALDG